MADPEKPSRARYWVVVFVSALALILYVDRVCISKAQDPVTSMDEPDGPPRQPRLA